MTETNSEKKQETKDESTPAKPSLLGKHRLIIMTVVMIVLVVAVWVFRNQFAIIPNSQARKSLEQRQVDKALEWLDTSQWLDPGNAEAEFLRARIRRLDGDFEGLAEHLGKAEQYGYSSEAIEREKWLAWAQDGKLRLAEPHLAELLEDQRGDGAEICHAFVLGFLKMHKTKDVEFLATSWMNEYEEDPRPCYYLGQHLLSLGRWLNAEKHFRLACERDPNYHPASLMLGKTLLENHKAEEALEYFKSAQSGDVEKTQAMIGEAMCHRELDDAQKAQDLLDQVLEQEPDNVEAILQRAKVDLDARKYADAFGRLAPIAADHPANLDLRNAYANALRAVGQTDAAKKEYEAANQLRRLNDREQNYSERIFVEPTDIDARFEAGKMLITNRGSEHRGLTWLLSVLEINPNHEPTHRALAEYYEARKPATAEDQKRAKFHRERAGKDTSSESKKASSKND